MARAPDLARLHATLEDLNRLRREASTAVSDPEVAIEQRYRASMRFAVYGSLAPGESNHSLVAQLRGTWSDGFVHGEPQDRGWGARLGFPALRCDPNGRLVAVKLLVSEDLPSYWPRLDVFEGEDYTRILVPVLDDAGGVAVANLYEGRR